MSKSFDKRYDVLVVGGGHAGCEAYAAACRAGAGACLVTPSLAELAVQPCNPAVGGPGKGHLVREVVALGGLMGRVTDRSGIQFRVLNRRKGPAVRATRVQTDSAGYVREMASSVASVPGGDLIEDTALGLIWSRTGARRAVLGARLARRGDVRARAVVLATGTFLRGLLYTGDRVVPGGRRGAPPAEALARSLEEAGLPLFRLKTGTCPRLAGDSVDTTGLEAQAGDEPPPFFDPETTSTSLPQRVCHVVYTDRRVHRIIERNMRRSALYGGEISGIGPRYCPSIETKVARFPEKDRHQIFLEPEDRLGRVVYPSGLSTSLPADVQEEMVRALPGLERARIVHWGYAVEYDSIQPRCLDRSLRVDGFEGLYVAGQIAGTSGYEEAAALGLLAGANAALDSRGEPPIELGRDRAYMGVLVDDLTTRGVDEPYRMLTSRAEYRLMLREDNAEDRLVEEGIRTGLLRGERAAAARDRIDRVREAVRRLSETRLTPSASVNDRLDALGQPRIRKPVSLLDLVRRAGVRAADLSPLAPWIAEVPAAALARIDVEAKYDGYLHRQRSLVERLGEVEGIRIPESIDYRGIPGLRSEMIERLDRARPRTLGQASRLPGITPATVEVLHVWCRRGAGGGRHRTRAGSVDMGYTRPVDEGNRGSG